MTEPTRIIAIRHGETTWNVDTRIQGHLDIPLNATGRHQAARMALALKDEPIAAVYASDLTRAWETAQYLGRVHGLQVNPETGLRERGFGDFEGKTFAEKLKEEVVAKAHQQAQREIQHAKEEIQRDVDAAKQQLRNEVADLAVLAAGKILDETLDAQRHKKIVDGFLNQLPNS